ncbi:MAG: phosphoribosyltransferase family protein [Chloroflexota bacterium]
MQSQSTPLLDRNIFSLYEDTRYIDREIIGHRLAEELYNHRTSSARILALPTGGLIVAIEIARVLRLPLDVLVAREFYIPEHPGMVAGGVSEEGGLCLNAAIFRLPDVKVPTVWQTAHQTLHQIKELAIEYRTGRPLPNLSRRSVILVDDGIGSGLAQLAALQAVRRRHPRRCIVATPGGAVNALQHVAKQADVVVSLTWETEPHQGHLAQIEQPIPDDETVALFTQQQIGALHS